MIPMKMALGQYKSSDEDVCEWRRVVRKNRVNVKDMLLKGSNKIDGGEDDES